MLTSSTRFVLSHKRLVTAFWVVVTIVGLATVSQAAGAFSDKFSVSGRGEAPGCAPGHPDRFVRVNR